MCFPIFFPVIREATFSIFQRLHVFYCEYFKKPVHALVLLATQIRTIPLPLKKKEQNDFGTHFAKCEYKTEAGSKNSLYLHFHYEVFNTFHQKSYFFCLLN